MGDDTAATFIGAREQDNEALAFESELSNARAKDSEQEMVELRNNSMPNADVLPDAQGEQKPEVLPDAEGTTASTEGKDIVPESNLLEDIPRIAGDIAAGLPKNFTAGTLRAAKEAFDAVVPGALERGDSALVDLGLGDYVESVNGFMNEIENGGGTGDKVVQELAQFAVPFSLYMKGLGVASQMGTVSKAITADGLASFFNLDPHMERLSQVVAEMGIHNEFVAYLADEGGTDSENRFRNVLENQALGGALGLSLFGMVKAFKGVMWTGKSLKNHIDKVGFDEFIKSPAVKPKKVGANEIREPAQTGVQAAAARRSGGGVSDLYNGFKKESDIKRYIKDTRKEIDSGGTAFQVPDEVMRYMNTKGITLAEGAK